MEVTAAESYASGGPARELQAQNLALAFQATVDRIGDDPAIVAGAGDDEIRITWNELRERVGRIAGGLAKLGVAKGDTVAIMLNNRPEFIPLDLAAVSLGGVPFSIYQTSSPEQIRVRGLGRRGEGRDRRIGLPRRLQRGSRGATGDRDPGRDRRRGRRPHARGLEQMDPDFDVSGPVAAVGPDDLLTLIYTSGTTGPPKGVQLTHRNLMTLTAGVDDIVDFPDRGAKVISWLPAAHIAERGAHYYLPVISRLHGDDLPEPARDHRLSAEGAARPGSSPCRGSGRSSRPGWRPTSPACPASRASRREAGARRRR